MQTLSQMRDRVLSMESHYDTVDQRVIDGVVYALNEALDVLYEEAPWWFGVAETSIVSTVSGTSLVLADRTAWVLGVYGDDGEPLEPRTRQRQLDYATAMTNKGVKSYALDGLDSVTGFAKLTLHPATEGTFTVRYIALPAELVADDDEPAGPRTLCHFLVHYARWLRLEADEEREGLRRSAWRNAQTHLARLRKQNEMFFASLRHAVSVSRG